MQALKSAGNPGLAGRAARAWTVDLPAAASGAKSIIRVRAAGVNQRAYIWQTGHETMLPSSLASESRGLRMPGCSGVPAQGPAWTFLSRKPSRSHLKSAWLLRSQSSRRTWTLSKKPRFATTDPSIASRSQAFKMSCKLRPSSTGGRRLSELDLDAGAPV